MERLSKGRARKGQASLEFLMTYGWALLMILVAIGALAYFGILNPSDVLPEKCIFPQELPCGEYVLTNDSITFQVQNSASQIAELEQVEYKETKESTYRNCSLITPPLPRKMLIEQKVVFDCEHNLTQNINNKVKVNFRIKYNVGNLQFQRTAFGEMFATMQQE